MASSDKVDTSPLELLAFSSSGVKQASCHTVVVRMHANAYPVAIVSATGDLVEVLTPNDPEFKKTLQMLESVAQVKLKQPTKVRVEGS